MALKIIKKENDNVKHIPECVDLDTLKNTLSSKNIVFLRLKHATCGENNDK